MRVLETVAIGIDLAWTRKNPSALAVVSDELVLIDWVLCYEDYEIIEFVERHNAENIIVCIDAPLIFPEEITSFRKCDAMLRKRGTRILPVQQAFFMKRFGCLRGKEIVKMLEEKGFLLSIQSHQRQIIEVYPHATWKRMLRKVPKYKNVSQAKKREAIGLLSRSLVKAGLSKIEVMDLRGSYAGDLLDAAVCALVGIWHLQGKTEVIGDEKDGFIVY